MTLEIVTGYSQRVVASLLEPRPLVFCSSLLLTSICTFMRAPALTPALAMRNE